MKRKDNYGRFDIYKAVTTRIMRRLSSGEIPWRKTWTARRGARHPYINHFTGKPYSFLNTLLLGEPGEYATFRQIKEAGGHVRKGASSSMVIYWGEFTPKENREEAKRLEEEGKDASHLKVRFPKYYNVFNINDAEGLPPGEPEPAPMTASEDPTDVAELVIGDYTTDEAVTVEERDGLEPAYLPESDTVTLPAKASFTYEEDFYASLFGMLAHSTAREGRCSREQEMRAMTEGRMTVKESLIAEICSSMILSAAGMRRRETHDQIAAECQRWMEVMSNDYRLIVTASYGAEKAARLILGKHAA